MHCINCKYAAFSTGSPNARCELISDLSPDDKCEVTEDAKASRLAFTCDADFYFSELIVEANFGCIHFEQN